MRITLVVPSLGCGGTERVVTAMANYWAAQGKDVTVLTCDHKTNEQFFLLEKNVTHRALNLLAESKNSFAGLLHNVTRIFTLRKAILLTRPTIVISFLVKNNVRVLLAMKGTKIPVIVSERSDPAAAKLNKVWDFLVAQTYVGAAQITVFTRHVANTFPPRWQQKIVVIPNPIAAISPPPTMANKQFCVIGIGRLEVEKGFDLLLQAFALVTKKIPAAYLKIWGDGSQKNNLQILARQLGIADKVLFCGVTANINDAFNESGIFVQASRCEGFGNALCEAMAAGLPVIATACSGPQEIIRHDIDGILVPVGDVVALAAAMAKLLLDCNKRAALATAALEVKERFSLPRVMRAWDELLLAVTH